MYGTYMSLPNNSFFMLKYDFLCMLRNKNQDE